MKKSIPIIFLGIVFDCLSAYSQPEPEYSISPWFENKKAAVSITFDDNESGQFSHAVPIMNEKGIKATFFVITENVENNNQWADLQKALDAGHEVGSHSVSHPNDIAGLDSSLIEQELKDSHDSILSKLNGQTHLTIAWPFGKGGGSSKNDSVVRSIAGKYYFAARNAAAGIANVGDSYNHYLNSFFTTPGRNYYLQTGGVLMASDTHKDDMGKMVAELIEINGWSVPFYHGIETGGYNNISAEDFKAHIDTLASLQEKIWITTFGNASRYHHQRNAEAVLSVVSETDQVWELSLTDTLSNNEIFNHPLTIRLKKPAFEIKSITQGGESVSFKTDGDTIQFNVVPDRENIFILKEKDTSLNQISQDKPVLSYSPGEIAVSFPAEDANSYMAELYTPAGQAVSNILISKNGEKKLTIYNGHLTKGVYILFLKTKNGSHFFTYKILI